jgi:hypothetical protein
MADRDVTPNDQRVSIMSDMQHAEVLHVGPISDPNVVHIAADHGVEPDAALLTHHHIADHDSGLFDKA